MTHDTKNNIENQKKFYKTNKGSICLNCRKINEDCFLKEKVTANSLAKDNHYSRIVRCNDFKAKD